jgi:ribosomal protein L11
MNQEIFLKVKSGSISSSALGASKLGTSGAPVKKVIQQINNLTKQDIDMKVLVKVDLLGKGAYKVSIPNQPISYKLLKLIGKKKGSKSGEIIGELNKKELEKFVNMNFDSEVYEDPKQMLSQVIGSCHTLGIKLNE